MNDVAYHISAFFSKKSSFIELSQNLATHLYASAHHPNIAAGDLFVILFDQLKVDGKYKSAIGIYKSELKQQYISTNTVGKARRLEVSTGINPDLIDKGVLIVDGSEIIYAIDRLSSRTKYWVDDFLKAKQLPNETTTSAMAVGLIEKVRENIENPIDRQEFGQEVIALCEGQEEVFGDEIKNISEKYVSSDVWEAELSRIIEKKGLVNPEEISVSTKRLGIKLKRVLSKINLSHDITLTIPDNLSFKDVDFKINEKKIQINLKLEDKNG